MEPVLLSPDSPMPFENNPGSFMTERAFAAWLAERLGSDSPPSRLTIRRLRDRGMPVLWLGGRTYFQPDEAWTWILTHCMHQAQNQASAQLMAPQVIPPSALVVPAIRRKAG